LKWPKQATKTHNTKNNNNTVTAATAYKQHEYSNQLFFSQKNIYIAFIASRYNALQPTYFS
jgi:hypothetical protein